MSGYHASQPGSGQSEIHPKRSFVPCWRTRFRLPARRLRLRFLPKIWVRLCGCARFTQRQPAASPERAGGLQAVPWLPSQAAKFAGWRSASAASRDRLHRFAVAEGSRSSDMRDRYGGPNKDEDQAGMAIRALWRGLVWLFIGPRPRLVALRHARAARRYMFVHKPITRLHIRTLSISLP